jgi:hypothetical protein
MIIFKREKTPIELVYMKYMYILRSNSFILASEILKTLINRNHESIRLWWHKFDNISKIINKNIKSKIESFKIDYNYIRIHKKMKNLH